MDNQFITVLAYHGTSYHLVTINMQHVTTIETVDDITTQIALIDGRIIRAAGTIADVWPTPGYIAPQAQKIFETEKTRLDGNFF